MSETRTKVGIYIDTSNISQNGGFGMQFDVLRQYACHDDAEAVRMNVYVAYDEERAVEDAVYRNRTLGFYSTIRDFGYKVIEKRVKRYVDEQGNIMTKSNSDLDMAVDALLQSDKLDRVVLCTGDGDFIQVVRALQNKGCRVEVIAFDNVSQDLRREADVFMSGYLVPNLLPVQNAERSLPWGEIGSRVRGSCYFHKEAEQYSYGFMRFLRHINDNLWITDTRAKESPFGTAYFNDTSFVDRVNGNDLPNRNIIFEFELMKSTKNDGLEARNIRMAARL
ncbi:MAG TPA: NYN domain-containing protein [Thermoflexales bacterium]|nr:NYN domain-containing protein [Thermoflexales bacterium]HQW36207.1 NYN domain-containing protein [Thermoflexales bacterium]HQX76256.1 NYN domain-containing protein [Thermoflexales bacterium]HQZ22226.1 NYN domain-containing protein [Thermoflexales bacterium]HRA00792.1 NYN domain-containing protein [Thermoflexales bacterium]